MELDSGPTISSSNQVDGTSKGFQLQDEDQNDLEDPYSLGRAFIALLGVAIAIATVGIPLAAVLTEKPLKRESNVPTVLEIDGSKPTPPVSLTRVGESDS